MSDPETIIDAATLEELQRLASSRPPVGAPERRRRASALRTLERLARGSRRTVLPPCPPDWHPGPPEFEELDRVHLEEHPEVRQRMWEIWHDR